MSWGRLFDDVPVLYDEVRPDYPAAVYDAIEAATGSLRGKRLLDLAAGPGTATRQLVARGARVVAVDPGARLLGQLRSRSPGIPAVAAVAEHLPFADDSVDLVTCATAWHWFDVRQATREVRRVVRPGGHLALWWANHRHGDGVEWEDAQSAVFRRWEVERGSRAPDHRGVGPWDVAAELVERGLDVVVERVVEWSRQVSRATHLQVLRTHSDNLALGERSEDLVAEIAAALEPWPVVTERLWGPLVVARIT